jgi:hypothetical protein
MYAMKVVASSVFHTMMFPHNGKIITIDQLTHYEPNHSTNIDNILPLVHVSSNDFPVANIGPGLFQDPSMLDTYQGAPPFLNPSFSAQVCVVSSKGTDIRDKTPITESPPHIKVPPVEEILPQEFPESATHHLSQISPPPGENLGIVSTSTQYGSSTIPPSSVRGNPSANSNTCSYHTTLTPNH